MSAGGKSGGNINYQEKTTSGEQNGYFSNIEVYQSANFYCDVKIKGTLILSVPLPIISGGTGLSTLGAAGKGLLSTGSALAYSDVVTSVTLDTASVPFIFVNSSNSSTITNTGTFTLTANTTGTGDHVVLQTSPILKTNVGLLGANSSLLTLQPSSDTLAYTWIFPSTIGSVGQLLLSQGLGNQLLWVTPGTFGVGTVTSVSQTVPSFLSISGSPITTSGTLSITLSGTALPTTSGGTGLTTVGSTGQVLTSNGTSLYYDSNINTGRIEINSTICADVSQSQAATIKGAIYNKGGLYMDKNFYIQGDYLEPFDTGTLYVIKDMNIIKTPVLSSTYPVSYLGAASFTIDGNPLAGTNVTFTGGSTLDLFPTNVALHVKGASYLQGLAYVTGAFSVTGAAAFTGNTTIGVSVLPYVVGTKILGEVTFGNSMIPYNTSSVDFKRSNITVDVHSTLKFSGIATTQTLYIGQDLASTNSWLPSIIFQGFDNQNPLLTLSVLTGFPSISEPRITFGNLENYSFDIIDGTSFYGTRFRDKTAQKNRNLDVGVDVSGYDYIPQVKMTNSNGNTLTMTSDLTAQRFIWTVSSTSVFEMGVTNNQNIPFLKMTKSNGNTLTMTSDSVAQRFIWTKSSASVFEMGVGDIPYFKIVQGISNHLNSSSRWCEDDASQVKVLISKTGIKVGIDSTSSTLSTDGGIECVYINVNQNLKVVGNIYVGPLNAPKITMNASGSISSESLSTTAGVTVGGNLSVTGTSGFTGTVTTQALTVGGNLSVTGTSGFTGSVTTQALTVGSNLSVTGTSTFTGAVSTTSAVTVGGSLIVTGTSQMTGAVSTTAAVTVGGALTVTGSTTLTGSTSITGNISIGGNFTVTGTSTFTGLVSTLAVNIGGLLSVAGASNFTGLLTTTGGVIVGGTLNVGGLLNTIGGVQIGGALSVAGATSLGGALSVGGLFTVLVGGGIINGVFTINGGTFCNGALTVSGAFTVTGALTITGPFTVTGLFTVNGASIINGATTINGAFAVTGIGAAFTFPAAGAFFVNTLGGLASILTGAGAIALTTAAGLINLTTGAGAINLTTFTGGIGLYCNSGVNTSITIQNSTTGDMQLTCGSGNLRINANQGAILMGAPNGGLNIGDNGQGGFGELGRLHIRTTNSGTASATGNVLIETNGAGNFLGPGDILLDTTNARNGDITLTSKGTVSLLSQKNIVINATNGGDVLETGNILIETNAAEVGFLGPGNILVDTTNAFTGDITLTSKGIMSLLSQKNIVINTTTGCNVTGGKLEVAAGVRILATGLHVLGAPGMSTQGAGIGWNYSGGTGETNFFNNNANGVVPGGWTWIPTTNTSVGSPVMSLSQAGTLACSNITVTTSNSNDALTLINTVQTNTIITIGRSNNTGNVAQIYMSYIGNNDPANNFAIAFGGKSPVVQFFNDFSTKFSGRVLINTTSSSYTDPVFSITNTNYLPLISMALLAPNVADGQGILSIHGKSGDLGNTMVTSYNHASNNHANNSYSFGFYNKPSNLVLKNDLSSSFGGKVEVAAGVRILANGLHILATPNMSTEGAGIGWNNSGGVGETNFFNNNANGVVPGGWTWIPTTNTSVGSPVMSLTQTGNLTLSGTISATNLTNGTVTSVSQTVPSFLSVAGSPITTSGTLAITLSGTALPTTSGGTGLVTVGTAGQILSSNGTSLAWVFPTPPTNGTVTSVAVTVPSFMTVTGSPITTAGTCTINDRYYCHQRHIYWNWIRCFTKFT